MFKHIPSIFFRMMDRCIVATWYMLSSLLWPREEAAVAEWLDSGLPFHVMRWDQLELALSHHFSIAIGMILQGQPLSLHCHPGRYVGGTNGHWDEEYSWHKLQTTHEQCKDNTTLKLIDTWGLNNNIMVNAPRLLDQSTGTKGWIKPCLPNGFGHR